MSLAIDETRYPQSHRRPMLPACPVGAIEHPRIAPLLKDMLEKR